MCDFDDSERPKVWRTSTAKARKQYRCDECRRAIEPGETYTRDFAVFDSDVYTGFMCAHCLIARVWLMENCGGWAGGLAQLMGEHAVEYPDIATGLIRLRDGIHAGWCSGGALMPVPEMPDGIDSTMVLA